MSPTGKKLMGHVRIKEYNVVWPTDKCLFTATVAALVPSTAHGEKSTHISPTDIENNMLALLCKKGTQLTLQTVLLWYDLQHFKKSVSLKVYLLAAVGGHNTFCQRLWTTKTVVQWLKKTRGEICAFVSKRMRITHEEGIISMTGVQRQFPEGHFRK